MNGWTDDELNRQIERLRQLDLDCVRTEIQSSIEKLPSNGLRLAMRVLNRRADMEWLLCIGLERGEFREIDGWIRVCYPRIGARRVAAILREWIEKDANIVYHATYALRCLRTRHPEIVGESDSEIFKALWKDLAKVPSLWGLID
ncbi:MAG: hypothetical protein H6819_07325 [Phycisphaerales bacterium]|nr:hypothetical protein [Phycisphaerales bacterium]MCB9857695.1 hypothetical protein [Phycisphaerales bacterium]MCB9864784.1 hypothetical protein [Phycisphaerales bacterium]